MRPSTSMRSSTSIGAALAGPPWDRTWRR
jgi:hypothetical protein